MSSGIIDSSLKFHLQNAKAHGVSQKDIATVITHVAFIQAGQVLIWLNRKVFFHNFYKFF